MDVQKLAQRTLDDFNNRKYRQSAKEIAEPDIVVIDAPTGQQMKGIDGFVQYSESFINAMPDLRGTALEHQVNGNQVVTKVEARGTFTGTLKTPQGTYEGTGKPVDITYQLDQEFDNAGKLTRFAINYDLNDFMRQLGLS